MFPFDLEDELEIIQEETKEPKDYEIDFKTGKLTGRMVTGIKAIEQWIYLALKTDRYFFTQYSWDFGSELSTLIGKHVSREYVESEVKRMVQDALLVNEYITSIENLTCSIENDVLVAAFTVNTVYGVVEINV